MSNPIWPLRVPEGSINNRTKVGTDNLWFYDRFSYAAQNTSVWQSVLTTMTVTHSPAGFIGLNAGASVASGAVANYLTYKHFPIYGGAGLDLEVNALFTIAPTTNNLMEIGLFQAATTAAPLDGILFRITAAGLFLGVVNCNGTEATVDLGTAPTAAVVNSYRIVVDRDFVAFIVNDVPRGQLPSPTTLAGPSCNIFAPIHFRNHNSGAVSPTAQVLRIADVRLLLTDIVDARPWAQMAAAMGDMGIQGHAGATMGSTALYTNSLAIGAGAAMTNTTAALGSGLGGQFTTTATLAAGTEGVVSSYQVPAGTALIPGKSLVINGVWIDSKCSAAITGGPLTFAMALCVGGSTVSLAVAEAANTKAYRRTPLGWQSFVITAPLGQKSDEGRIWQPFLSPIVALPGEFVAVSAKNINTVATVGTITFLIGFDAHWE